MILYLQSSNIAIMIKGVAVNIMWDIILERNGTCRFTYHSVIYHSES